MWWLGNFLLPGSLSKYSYHWWEKLIFRLFSFISIAKKYPKFYFLGGNRFWSFNYPFKALKKLVQKPLVHYRSKTHFCNDNYPFQQKYVNFRIRNDVELIKRIFGQKWRNLNFFWNQWDPNPRTSRPGHFTK